MTCKPLDDETRERLQAGWPEEGQATPAHILETQIMHLRIPKNEREWWARREIELLRDKVEALQSCACADCNREILELRAEVERLRAEYTLNLALLAKERDGYKRHNEELMMSHVSEVEALRRELAATTAERDRAMKACEQIGANWTAEVEALRDELAQACGYDSYAEQLFQEGLRRKTDEAIDAALAAGRGE